MRTNARPVLTAILATTLATAACETRTVYVQAPPPPPQPTRYVQPAAQAQQVQQQTLLDPSVFDLETVSGLLRTNRVQNAQQLEQLINTQPGLNNVDIDGDGQIDYIGVQESASGNGRQFAFVACPSSRNGNNVTVATVSFVDQGGNIQVAAGYTNIVSGYDSLYYTYYVPRTSFGQMLFYSWLFSARPYYVYHPYGYGYMPRPMMHGDVLRTTRTTTRTQMHVAPVARTAPPAGYTQRATTMQPSRLAAPPRATAPGVTGATSGTADFQRRDSAQPKLNGNSFGGGSVAAPPARPTAPIAAPAPAVRPTAPIAPMPATRPAPTTTAPAFRAPAAPVFRAPAPSAPTFRTPAAPSFGGKRK